MTDQALHDLILADPTAKAQADLGNDVAVAATIAATLPPSVSSRLVGGASILGAFANPADGLAAITAVTAAAASNPTLAYVLPWLAPGAPGIDLGSPAVIAMIDQLEAAGVLTSAAANTILALAQSPAVVDFNQVSRALIPYRATGA